MVDTQSMEKLWRSYAETKDAAIREKMIIEYAHLVKYVARKLSMHLGQHVEFEDLVSYGIFGLIDAIDKYDVDKGVKFETYAGVRIRGAIIDNIRKMDWVPRTLRQKNKQLENVYLELEKELGRDPTDEEISERLNISIDETQDLIKKSSVVSLVSLDDYLDQNQETGFMGSDKTRETPETAYEIEEVKQMLADAIDKLSEKEQKVVSLYYFEELSLKEISQIMGVTESRISQIHSKAVLRLKSKLGKYKSILF